MAAGRSRAGSRSSARASSTSRRSSPPPGQHGSYYVVEHDPRFERPDVRPVRGRREGLRLPRLRDVLMRRARRHRRRARAAARRPAAARPRRRRPTRSSRRSSIDATPGEPMDLAVLPDARVLHTERSGEVWLHNPATGPEDARGQARRLPARRGRAAEHRAGPELRLQPLGLPVLLAAAGHPGRRPGDADGQRGRRAVLRHAGGLRAVQGPHPALALQVERARRSTSRTEQKILQVPVDRGICCHVGGDIVFDAGRQPDPVHRRRHEPVRVRRLHADRRARGPQPGLRRAAHVGQHQRPARQGPAHHGRRRAAATRSRPATCSSTRTR